MDPYRLQLSLSGNDLPALASLLCDQPEFAGTPSSVMVDDKAVGSVGNHWLAEHVPRATNTLFAEWNEDPSQYLNIWVGLAIQASVPNTTDPTSWVNRLVSMPIELATVGSPHATIWKRKRYRPCSFADMHYPHGWVSILKRAGHDRLVSRRWLDHGPWKLAHEDGDASVLTFHSLSADAETARSQAEPGHKRLGIDRSGGFLQTNFIYDNDFTGYHLKDQNELRIVVAGREVTESEMLDACAFRHYEHERNIERVVYVLPIEEEARAHLHALWLRGFECWTLIDGKEVRLDLDYEPPAPKKPDWA